MTITRALTTDTDDAEEKIFGVDLTWTECDALALTHIRKDWTALERPLFQSKWFDYRFMHPVHASYLYTYYWSKAYKTYYEKSFDARAAEHIKPLKDDDLFRNNKMLIAGIWRGRQCADAIGMPYELFLHLAMSEALRYWKQRYMPRPTHLYSHDIVTRVTAKWEELQSARLFYAAHSDYRLHHYKGTQAQDDHHEWLLTQAGKRSDPTAVLRRLFEQDLLPPEKVAMRFGDQMLSDIQR